jgi:hypothetical protein
MWVLFVTGNLHHPCYLLPGNAWRSSRNFGYALRCEVGDVLLVCCCHRRVTHFWNTWPQDENAWGGGGRARRRHGPLLLRPDVLWSNPAPTGRFWGAGGRVACPTYPFLQTPDKYCSERFRQRSSGDRDAARKRSRSDINWSSFMVSVKITFALRNQKLSQLEEEKTTKTQVTSLEV